jgi:Cof subfamily protein (haloacid dehalogenase superfamily)
MEIKNDIEVLKERSKEIKLFATDLDGTLFDRKHMLSAVNRAALETLAKKGIILAAATGRARNTIPETIISLPGMKYIISANGAKIFQNDTGEIIYEKNMTADVLDHIRPFFSDDEVLIEVFWDGTPHVEEYRYIAARDYGIPKWFSDYFFRSRQPLENFEAEVDKHKHEIENITFVFSGESVKNRVYSFLKKRTDLYTLTSAFDFHFEIGAIGVDKGAAVDFLAKREGISADECICFGDHDNDKTMVEYAGIGVAVGNASPGVLSAADYITDDNESDGVASALKKLGLV